MLMTEGNKLPYCLEPTSVLYYLGECRGDGHGHRRCMTPYKFLPEILTILTTAPTGIDTFAEGVLYMVVAYVDKS